MNEMLRSLGFGQVTGAKWTNGETMTIEVNPINLAMVCYGDINYNKDDYSSWVEYAIKATDLETMKRHVEKFMRMVDKCIQVDEE